MCSLTIECVLYRPLHSGALSPWFQIVRYVYDDVTYVYDDVTYVYDYVTYVYDDVR